MVAMEKKQYEIIKFGESLHFKAIGSSAEIAEWVEEQMNKSSLGFGPMVEMDEDEDFLFLHSDNEEKLSEDEIRELTSIGINIRDAHEKQHQAILEYLGVSIHQVIS